MDDYILETGACLVLFWLVLCLGGLITFAVIGGVWPLATLYPIVLFLLVLCWQLWQTRPSLNRPKA
jgi:hypothetical protein